MEGTFNIEEAIKAQGKYCKENGYPHFAPHTGRCYRCNKNIYKKIEHETRDNTTGEVVRTFATGISVEKAGQELITECPHCNWSYCD